MGSEAIFFVSGELLLEGVFTSPTHAPVGAGIVICHPHPLYGGDMWNNVVRAIAEAASAVGHAVLRFNFRGVGKSTGSYDEGIGEQEDVRAALTWLAAHPTMQGRRLWLAGYSFGARATLAVVDTDPRVYGFIAVAPPVLRGAWPSMTAFHGPKLFISGDEDQHAPPEALASRVDSLPEPRRLVFLPGVDHFFMGQELALGQHVVTLLRAFS
jgi:hypothetical protein